MRNIALFLFFCPYCIPGSDDVFVYEKLAKGGREKSKKMTKYFSTAPPRLDRRSEQEPVPVVSCRKGTAAFCGIFGSRIAKGLCGNTGRGERLIY